MRTWGSSRIRNSRIHHHTARRVGLAATGLALIAGVLPVVGALVPGTTGVALADDITASQNVMRTSWDSSESALTPTAVSHFGAAPLWNASVDGDVYAQPLVVGSTVIVATEADWVYGFNATSGAQLWGTKLGNAYPISSVSTFSKCTDLVPNIGVTGTPAYDSSTGDIYFFANIMSGSSPEYYMVQMNLSGGVISKTPITGHPSNDSLNFSAKYNMERPGVLIYNGGVYGAFASHCDTKPYDGYVVRVDQTSHATSMWSDESGTTYDQAGIWQSGGGIMTDPNNTSAGIFVTSGNGVSPPKSSKPGGQLAESVIRLTYNSGSNTLSAQDFFSPRAAPSWDASDTDYGSGGPVDVGNFTVGGLNTLVQIGKNGQAWLLNRGNLGGREQGSGGSDKDLFVTKAYGGEWGHPAIFGDTNVTIANSHTTPTDNDFMFSVGKDDKLRVFRFFEASNGTVGLTNLATSSVTYGYTSGSPVVTSNGADATSAVVWEVFTPNTTGKTGVGSELDAYQLGNVASINGVPSPCSSTHMCTLTPIWHSTTFTAAKFTIPATSNGWVYVGTRDGHVLAFAAPGSKTTPAVTTTATLPHTAVGSTSTQAVSVTATQTVTITGATASTGANNTQTTTASEFTAGQASVTKSGSTTPTNVTFPVTLNPGDKLSVQTTFSPVVAGGSSGTLSLSTNSGATPAIDVPLVAEGIQQGIYAEPSTQTFVWAPDWPTVIDVPIGGVKPETITISNYGTKTETITRVTPPVAPFSASNLPTVGTKLNPGASIVVQVSFTPTNTGTATGSFTIAGSSGQKAVVSLSAIATSAVSQLTTVIDSTPPTGGLANAVASRFSSGTATKPGVNFGSVTVGKTVKAYIQVTQNGNTPATVIGVAGLKAPFAAPLEPTAGLSFNPSDDLLLPVTFTPTKTGKFTAKYKLHWQDVTGKHTLVVTLTGTGV